jgi:hypothetical protein
LGFLKFYVKGKFSFPHSASKTCTAWPWLCIITLAARYDCAPLPRFALPPPPLTLPLSPHRHQSAANIALSCCHQHRSLRAAAAALLPSCYALPPRFALPTPPLMLPLPPCRRQASADVLMQHINAGFYHGVGTMCTSIT